MHCQHRLAPCCPLLPALDILHLAYPEARLYIVHLFVYSANTGPYLKTSSMYDVHQNWCVHAMHSCTHQRSPRFITFSGTRSRTKIVYVALANAQKTSIPCQNLEFDARDCQFMLYLLHREERSYLLEEVRVHSPRVPHLHILDFNKKKTAHHQKLMFSCLKLKLKKIITAVLICHQWIPIIRREQDHLGNHNLTFWDI